MNLLFVVFAADPTPFINEETFPAARFFNLSRLVNILSPLLLIGAAIIFGVMMIIVGYTIITAGGDAEKVTKAQQIAMWAVVGIAIVISAYLLTKLIGYILGIEIPL